MPDDTLIEGEIELTGRIMPASNATFVGTIGDVPVVYKPIAGERPLWDFPDGTLAGREYAAYLVSEVFGSDIVPATWVQEGPAGRGMVQRWCEPDSAQQAVTVVAAGARPPGFLHVFDGIDGDSRPVSLVHEDSPALRQIAVFDAVVNNADRKGGHVLEMANGHRHGIDHGLTFHAEPKLRTVLWGWLGEPINEVELAAVLRVRSALDDHLATTLSTHISAPEIAALSARCDRLLEQARFPAPEGDMPAVPWPPL